MEMTGDEAVEQAASARPHTSEEMRGFLRSGPQAPAFLKTFGEMADKVLGNDADRARTSYAMDLVEADTLGKDAAIAILCRCWSRGMPVQRGLHALTIARALYPRMSEVSRKETTWGARLAAAVMGLDASPDRPPHAFDTQEGALSATAVVQFVLTNPGGTDGEVTRICDENEDESRRGRAIVNPHLELLIRERPEDVDRIAAYVEERGIRPASRRDVDDLREWLDMGAAAVSEGWL